MSATLTGPQKAAVVLAQLDPARANKILKTMAEREVVDLMSSMATLPPLDAHAVHQVVSEFQAQTSAFLQVGQGGVEVARKLLRDRLGQSRADEVLDQFQQAVSSHPLAFLQRIEAQQIASFVADEHPQTIAVVLPHLTADHAARVLACLDDSLRADVVRRIATTGRVSPDVILHLATVLENKLSKVLRSGYAGASEVGGLSSVVAILNNSERSAEKQILTDLETSDPDLAEEIRNEMFVFDDVVNLDDRTLQNILRNVVPKDLAVALKGATEEVRDKFLRNMSERAAQDLSEEIEVLGPTRISAVEAAQSAVVRVVRQLETSGEIVLARGDDEFVN